MRGGVEGLGTPYPLHTLMPALYQEDSFTLRLTLAVDQVLSPVISTIDCLEAYVDPMLAPDDFLQWLSSWFGERLDQEWPAARRRRFVAECVELFRTRGTVAGLRRQLELGTGGRVEIAESGGVSWSAKPGGELPGEDVPRLAVRITVEDASAVDEKAIAALIRAAKPAHVVHRLEVLSS
ncbi:MAG TPA: phage tail protein [Streptosporangiaceae bacterium]|jgi:phage tail-like protein|nr:phage tail protein [Streptosporangiaceae bacterium]